MIYVIKVVEVQGSKVSGDVRIFKRIVYFLLATLEIE